MHSPQRRGWIVPDHGAPEPLGAYETIVVRGPSTFTFVDELDTRAEPIDCGEHCATPEQGGTRHRLGWSDARDIDSGATTLITGAYPVRGDISRRLLDALPVVLRVEAGGTGDAVVDHLAAEVAVDAPGQQVVLDRLLARGVDGNLGGACTSGVTGSPPSTRRTTGSASSSRRLMSPRTG